MPPLDLLNHDWPLTIEPEALWALLGRLYVANKLQEAQIASAQQRLAQAHQRIQELETQQAPAPNGLPVGQEVAGGR